MKKVYFATKADVERLHSFFGQANKKDDKINARRFEETKRRRRSEQENQRTNASVWRNRIRGCKKKGEKGEGRRGEDGEATGNPAKPQPRSATRPTRG